MSDAFISVDGARLIGVFPSEHTARRNMLEWFRDMPDVLCVDMSPVAKWLECVVESGGMDAFRKEMNSLKATPIRPPAKVCCLAAVRRTASVTHPFGTSAVFLLTEEDGSGVFVSQGMAGEESHAVPGALERILLDDRGILTEVAAMQDRDVLDAPTLMLVIASLAMFHVKNIGMREVRFPRYLRRSFKKAGGEQGPTSYRTLTLRPFNDAENGQRRWMPTCEVPLHLVRGHFATYTAERKLFGKYVGTFWRPEHEAGNPSIAVVRKTYVMQPNDTESPPAPTAEHGEVA